MDSTKLLRSSGVVGGFTSLSRVLGLVRDVLMAGAFGTSLSMGAFTLAFTIPNLFRRLFGEGALSAALVPVFVKTKEEHGGTEAWALVQAVATRVALLLAILVLLGEAAITYGLGVFEFPEKVTVLLGLLRIMLPYMFFICLVGLAMGVLNSFGQFALPASTPCLLNLIWILAVVLFVPRTGDVAVEAISVVAWAILVAGFVQLGIQFPAMWKYGYRPVVRWGRGDAKVQRVFTLMLPAALGLAVTQVNVCFDKILGFWIGPWAAAALFYSERLIYLPLGVFGTAVGTVLLPSLSRHAAKGESGEMLKTINVSLRNLVFIMMPASVGLVVLAGPIVSMIFEWKNFDAQSTAYTSLALKFYAPGLLVFILAKVFVPVFYAQQDTRTPVIMGLQTVVIKLALSLIFISTWPAGMKHAGLAFATVLAEAYYGLRLAALVTRRVGSWREGLAGCLIRSAIACVPMALAAVFSRHVIYLTMTRLAWGAKAAQIGSVLMAIILAAFCYFIVMRLLRSRELKDVLSALRSRNNVE